jgi:RepB DNA-primase from phage plasmid
MKQVSQSCGQAATACKLHTGSGTSLGRFLAALFADSQPGDLVEVRVPSRPGWRRFFPIDRLDLVERHVRSCASHVDVYIGVAPRMPLLRGGRQFGGADAVGPSWWVWVDCDSEEACAALKAFTPHPTMIVSSGRWLHGYWHLTQPVAREPLALANAQLAAVIGADPSAADAARILRPPETWNHKPNRRVGGQPAPVRLWYLSDARYDLAEVVGVPVSALKPRRQARARRSGVVLRTGELTPEGRRRMLGIVRLLESTPVGQRHSRLYWAARAARALHDAGHISADVAFRALHAAAAGSGLVEDEGERAVRLTVRQGWEKGCSL